MTAYQARFLTDNIEFYKLAKPIFDKRSLLIGFLSGQVGFYNKGSPNMLPSPKMFPRTDLFS